MSKADIRSMSINELEQLALRLGEKEFRGRQVFSWIHKKHVSSFDEMSDLPKSFRAVLDSNCEFSPFSILEKVSENKAEDVKITGNTIKYLFTVGNNNIIESVLMNYSYGNAVCVSSQAGCRMGCAFCASAIGGLAADLTAGEMCSQVYEIQKDAGAGDRISHVVIMGSGEPLDNYDNVIRFINIINNSEGISIGQRHITLSTCGLVPEIYRLAEERLQITLAVSLHAPNDEVRRQIMPISKKYGMDHLLTACADYARVTNRRVTFEYALISGLNDSISFANELGGRLRRHGTASLSHVNLIPVNEVKERNWKKPDSETVKRFAETLEALGIKTTIRRKLGSGINAACGQLRRGVEKNKV